MWRWVVVCGRGSSIYSWRVDVATGSTANMGPSESNAAANAAALATQMQKTFIVAESAKLGLRSLAIIVFFRNVFQILPMPLQSS